MTPRLQYVVKIPTPEFSEPVIIVQYISVTWDKTPKFQWPGGYKSYVIIASNFSQNLKILLRPSFLWLGLFENWNLIPNSKSKLNPTNSTRQILNVKQSRCQTGNTHQISKNRDWLLLDCSIMPENGALSYWFFYLSCKNY